MSPLITTLRLRPRSKRALFLLALMLLLLAGGAAFLLSVRLSAASNLADREEYLELLTHKLLLVSKLRHADDVDMAQVSSVFISGGTTGLLNAELQRIINATASSSGLEITRIQPLDSEVNGGVTMIKMEIEGSGSITALRDFAHGAETGMPFLFITESHIARGSVPADQPGEAQPLTVRLSIQAFGNRNIAP